MILPGAVRGLFSSMLIAAGLSAGQVAPPAAAIPPQSTGVSSAPDAPAVANGWSVLVTRRGGFSATREISVTSAGVLACGAPSVCTPSLSSRELTAIAGLIPKSWPSFDTSPSSVCSDCEQTFLVLEQRDESGAPRLLIAHWDVTTQSRVPAELVRLASSVSGLLRSNTR